MTHNSSKMQKLTYMKKKTELMILSSLLFCRESGQITRYRVYGIMSSKNANVVVVMVMPKDLAIVRNE